MSPRRFLTGVWIGAAGLLRDDQRHHSKHRSVSDGHTTENQEARNLAVDQSPLHLISYVEFWPLQGMNLDTRVEMNFQLQIASH